MYPFIKKVLFVCLLSLASFSSYAQCAMCKANVESNLKTQNATIGKGINTGILYLMIMPYITFLVIAYFWYKSSKAESKQKAILSAAKAKLADRSNV